MGRVPAGQAVAGGAGGGRPGDSRRGAPSGQMSDAESKPVKGEIDGEGSEHVNLKVKGQVDARIFALLSARRAPPAPPAAPSARPYSAPRRCSEPRRDPTAGRRAWRHAGVRGAAEWARARRAHG